MSKYDITSYIPIHFESLLKKQFRNTIIFNPIPNKDINERPTHGNAKEYYTFNA